MGSVGGVGIDVEDGDTSAAAVGDDERAAGGGDAGEAGLFACAGDAGFRGGGQVDDGDGVGAGLGDVGAVAGGREGDEVGEAVYGDGWTTLLEAVPMTVTEPGLGRGAGVDDVDLIAEGVDGQAGGFEAYPAGAVLTEIDEVEDGDGVGGGVGA